jgi:hypothetical protein
MNPDSLKYNELTMKVKIASEGVICNFERSDLMPAFVHSIQISTVSFLHHLHLAVGRFSFRCFENPNIVAGCNQDKCYEKISQENAA